MSAIHPIVALESQQEQRLRDMLRKGIWPARSLKRAKVLLIANDKPHLSNTQIGQEMDCHRETVRNIKCRYFKEGLDSALFDKPKPGNGGKLDDKDRAYVIAKACTDAPQGYDHWTLELLRQQVRQRRGKEVCGETIRLVLKQNKLKPWLKKNVVHTRDNF
jgi:transposase